MPRKRVQVPDLEKPEPIRPAPVQSDTFAAPAPPPINNDLERLERALGIFATNVNAFARQQQAEMEKQLRLQHLAEYERWKAATAPDVQLDAYRTGQAPYFADPLLEDVVRRDWAEREANELAAAIDQDVLNGTAPLGMAGADLDAYVREKAAPYIERAARDPRLMVYFGSHLEKIRESVVKVHQEKLGEAQTAYFEDLAARKLEEAITRGIEQKLTPEQLTEALRPVYKELGPRVRGGSLDIKYSRMDDLMLDVLENLARDERYAETAFRLLHTERVGLEGSTRIGALSSVVRHRDKVAQIERLAIKTLGDKAEREITAAIRAGDTRLLAQMDGSIWMIPDFDQPNPEDPNRRITITAEKRREAAATAWLNEFRRQNGGINYDAELEVFMANGMKHPELSKILQQGFIGIANQNVSGQPMPDQLEKVRELADLYSRIADRNSVYAATLVDEKAREFYELYWTLTRFAERTGEQAAREVTMAFSGAAGVPQRSVESQVTTWQINNAVNKVDFSRLPFAGTPVNKAAVRQQLLTIANALNRVEQIDAAETLTKAANYITRNAAYVNGNAIFAPGIQKGDEEYVQPILDAIYERNAPYLKEKYGISSGKDLSILPIGSGQFVVVHRGGGAIDVPIWKEGKGDSQRVLGVGTVTIRTSDIQAIRAAAKARKEAEHIERKRQREQLEQRPLIRLNENDPVGRFIAHSLENLPRPGKSNLFGLSTEKEAREGTLRPGRSNLFGLTDK